MHQKKKKRSNEPVKFAKGSHANEKNMALVSGFEKITLSQKMAENVPMVRAVRNGTFFSGDFLRNPCCELRFFASNS